MSQDVPGCPKKSGTWDSGTSLPTQLGHPGCPGMSQQVLSCKGQPMAVLDHPGSDLCSGSTEFKDIESSHCTVVNIVDLMSQGLYS